METKAYDFGTLRFHRGTASFPSRFPVCTGMGLLRFPLVSCSFPFVSRFPPYTRETRNEAAVDGFGRRHNGGFAVIENSSKTSKANE
jgi:hypothetical protein